MDLLSKYNELKLMYLSANLTYTKTGKKSLKPILGWNDKRRTDPHICRYLHDEKMNSMIILNRTPIKEEQEDPDDYFLYVVDLDTKTDEEGLSGLEAFEKYVSSKVKINTLTQTTPSGGKHYLFKTKNEKLYNRQQIIKLTINGTKRHIDVPNCILSGPTNNYSWSNIGEYSNLNQIQELPTLLEDIILNDNGGQIQIQEKQEELKLVDIEGKFPLFDILINEFDDFKTWSRMAFYMKNLNYPLSLFLHYSAKFPKKYDEAEAKRQWQSVKYKKLNEGVLHVKAKNKNPIAYKETGLKFQYYKTDTLPDNIEFTSVNKEYLIKQDNINLTPKGCSISQKLKEFESDHAIKSFNIKSPYNTGKTQLLKRYISTYNPQKVLWLSYRKTLSNDIYGNFQELKFKNYMDGKSYDADRLILQLESLPKLKGYFQDEEDEQDIPFYDLVVIDEIESVLNQFNSNTIDKHSRTTFNFLQAIIKHSNKLITLDGDLSNRGFKFISSFEGSSINIINTTLKESKDINIIFDEAKFYNQIKADVLNNIKIVVACQSSKKAEELFEYIKSLDEDEIILDGCENNKIGLYVGATSDKKKQKLIDVKTEWSNLNILIYSPTIEAGVSYDVLGHFQKLYGIVGDNCNSQRAFIQQLSRVRKFQSPLVSILSTVKYYNFDSSFFNSYHEVKDNLISNNVIDLNETYDNGKIKKILTSYDINHIYNKQEQLLKDNKFFYLSYLIKLLESKGHEIIIDKVEEPEPETKKKTKQAEHEINNFKIDRNSIILNTKDIDEETFKHYLELQKRGETTEKQNLKIDKHFIKKRLGVNELDISILETYVKNKNTPELNNILYLIDVDNIRRTDTLKYNETKIKTELVKDILNKLKFKLFDEKIEITQDEFKDRYQEIIKTNNIFLNKGARTLFKSYNYKCVETSKQFLFFVNSILINYGLKISSNRRRIKKDKKQKPKEEDEEKEKEKEKEQFYKLEFISSFETVNEIIQYKKDKGFILFDRDNIRPVEVKTNFYSHLVLKPEPTTDTGKKD